VKILAIDPGLEATAIVYCPGFSVKSGMRWHLLDVPVLGEDAQRRPDAKALRDFIRKLSPDVAFIELVGSMPKQGIASTAKFMRATGILEGVVECCDVKLYRIGPQRWKKFHRVPPGSDKEFSRELAIDMIPAIRPWLTKKKHHGRAEAALIALYAEHCMCPVNSGDDLGAAL